jgi:hypothetical protein
MTTEKQIRARKRNWLIRRLMGARSIFSHENTALMEDATNMNQAPIYKCKDALDELIKIMRKT